MAVDLSDLNRLSFPTTVTYGLRKLEEVLEMAQNPHIHNTQQHIIDDYIFCYRDSSSHKPRGLNEVEGLVLVCELGSYLAQMSGPGSRNILFISLFHPGTNHHPRLPHRLPILATLISLAVATHNVAVLEAAAVWMQQVGYLNGWSDEVCQRLVKDFFQSGGQTPPHFNMALKALPGATPLFTANLITSIVQLYTKMGKNEPCSRPPLPLVSMIVWWLESSHTLALAPLTHPLPGISLPMTVTPPITPLIKLCVEAPFFESEDVKPKLMSIITTTTTTTTSTPTTPTPKEDVLPKSTSHDIYSQLHLAILQTLQSVPSLHQPMTQSQVLSCKQISEIVDGLGHRISESSVNNEAVQVSLNRLAQIILIAFKTRSLTTPINLEEKHMRDSLSRLPTSNRLIKTLLTSNKMWNSH